MVERRERACDEEVLQLGSEPRVYAEGILNVCKHYVESPLACISGVTGPDLKRRIELIMANRVGHRLNRAKKLLLASAGILVLAGPVAIGVSHATAMRAQSQAMSVPDTVANREAGTATSAAPIDAAPQSTSPPPVPPAPVQAVKPQQGSSAKRSTEKTLAFDVASIKPYSGGGGGGRNGGIGGNPPRAGGGGLRFMPGRIVSAPIGVTARKMILDSFHLTQYQLSGGPSWLDSDRFDLEAKAEGANENQLRLMLQTLLAERFKLVIHREAKEMPVYHLVVGKSGAKLHEWQEGDPMPSFGSDGRPKFIDRGTMQRLADTLSGGPDVGRPVLDKTGLPGIYVFYVVWDEGEEFLPAMQQQLGLKLESQKGPVDCIVIDRIEKPNAN
jgi:uncharacterized protein (TIGR03435 family)